MKAIKITTENAAELTAALLAVNGRCGAHTLDDGAFVVEIAKQFEDKLLGLVRYKKFADDAKAVWVSGAALPKSYDYKRTVTRLELVRHRGAWLLVDIQSVRAYQEAGPEYLILTPEQDAVAVNVLRSQYHIARAVKA